MGLFEEVGEDIALLDVQWALFEKVFGLHFDCSMLMAKCGCVCVLEGWEFDDRLQEYDDRLQEYVFVKRFTVTNSRFSTFRSLFLQIVVQKLLFFFYSQVSKEVMDVHVSSDEISHRRIGVVVFWIVILRGL